MFSNLFFRSIQRLLAIACTALSCALLVGCAATAQSRAPSATTVQNAMSDGSSMYAFDIDRTQLKVGDTWTYAYAGEMESYQLSTAYLGPKDGTPLIKVQGQFTHTVAALSAQETQLLVANPARTPFTVKAKSQYRMFDIDEAFVNLFDIFNQSMLAPYMKPSAPFPVGVPYQRTIDCSLPTPETITLASGKFNTLRYDCAYYYAPAKRAWTGKGGPYSIWYSKELKNIVQFKFSYPSTFSPIHLKEIKNAGLYITLTSYKLN